MMFLHLSTRLHASTRQARLTPVRGRFADGDTACLWGAEAAGLLAPL